MKECTKCKVEKPIADFWIDRRRNKAPEVLRRAIAYLVPEVAAEVIAAYMECRPNV